MLILLKYRSCTYTEFIQFFSANYVMERADWVYRNINFITNFECKVIWWHNPRACHQKATVWE